MESGLLCTVSDAVATVRLHHPAKRNAMTAAMWRDLPVTLDRLAADPGVRALVLTGSGDTFCAGADIADLRGDSTPQGLAVAAEEALAAFPKPTVAAVRGFCVGGGCQLAVACDLRFAAQDARFGITPAKLGIAYPAPSTRRLVGLVGPATAKYLLFSAELIDSGRALRTGLLDEVLPTAELDDRVAAFTRTLTGRSRLTQAAAKEFAAGPVPPERAAHWLRESEASGEAQEGVAAFLERRTPRFAWPETSGGDRGPGNPGQAGLAR
ncbi:enoyl-CoA hydratase/isomerase family protein [Streptomyces sp. JJ38]|uniref:enoyl-CoA hydratase/isomerase family protein n=1 Tax=Streptomyces sp. JJ38 TaxID=2738128 RepID=UPI001C58BB45|nr:enoyl-CoA hydratase/isomerase family protein [Streptomyces sp. JJ38]MBW1595978.1 enoyl-CoA hydratase/isomerase family protein [Streptomyces sp. JJ38]